MSPHDPLVALVKTTEGKAKGEPQTKPARKRAKLSTPTEITLPIENPLIR